MDPKLAEIYGTNKLDDADLEKLAAAELADGLADEDQMDTEGLSDDDLEAIAQEVLDESEGEEGQEKTSEAKEKLAEADYLGRVMAHSYVNELRGIQKTAADMPMESYGRPKTLTERAKKSLSETGTKVKEHAGRASEAIESRANKILEGGAAHAKKGFEFAKKHKGKGAIGALAIGGGLAARKAFKKQSSALETLVEARAQEILEASGIDPSELAPVAGQEKVSDPREALASAVDQRAWDLLGQYGIVPK